MKALGVDYGEVRIGIACSDDLGMFAHPLETVQTCESSPIARIAEIVAQRSIEIIIIGMPRSLDGSYGKSAQNVSDFVADTSQHKSSRSSPRSASSKLSQNLIRFKW